MLDDVNEEKPIAETNEEPVVTEEELIAVAMSEGLDHALVVEEEIPADTGKPLDLSAEEQASIMASMETVLFMSDKPVSLPKLRATINADVALGAYRTLMARLREEYALDHRGIEIAELALGFQLRTKAHMASVLRKMVKTQPLKLSPVTMEVLAVIAYKQPVTKDEIDSIRGVDSGYVLRNLMEKRLVRIAGRSELPGKPMVYGTTHEFLELFNMKDSKQLPPLHEVEQMVAASEVGFEEKQAAVMDEFGKMVDSNTKILFDDSQIDTELEALRAEIASIPTSTPFIDEQKAREKLEARLADLAVQGLTLDALGNEVPVGSVPSDAAYELLKPKAERKISITVEVAETASVIEDQPIEHQPSAELETAAAEAQWERHSAMIAEAVGEAQQIDATIPVIETAEITLETLEKDAPEPEASV
ncbi:MAG: SMC-Scp complex subunit ScpB [Deltaproteobacteria bacterium]|nr:SMC-Scp complex subunit ScpB [Deltaproteobacteria bacterium]